MEKGFNPILSVEGWQLSNAPVLSMAAHLASLEIFEAAGMDRLIWKGRLLSNFLLHILDDINNKSDHKIIEILTPKKDDEHGCQVSMLMLERGKEVFNELIKRGVIADWREPNVIRVAPVPLYNRFMDVYKFGEIISSILQKAVG